MYSIYIIRCVCVTTNGMESCSRITFIVSTVSVPSTSTLLNVTLSVVLSVGSKLPPPPPLATGGVYVKTPVVLLYVKLPVPLAVFCVTR